MQESPQLHKERELDRRNWIGCLLTLGVTAIVLVLIAVLPSGLFRMQSQPVWVLVLFALALLLITLVLGILAVVFVLRITSWAMEGERQRRQRGTLVLGRTLSGVATGADLNREFSSRELGRQLFLLFLFIVGINIAYIAVNLILHWIAPGAPGITSLALVFVLGAIVLLLNPSLLRARPLAVDKERPPLQVRRWIARTLYVLVILLPALGLVLPVVLLPVPVLVMPVLALAACMAGFMAGGAIYLLAPMAWIQAPVKRCDYGGALARAQLAANYSLFPGYYRNMAGVILLWAGRYDEARETFEQSIRETRAEGVSAGSAALENMGCALAWQGMYDEAIKMFEGSIAISESQVMVYSDLAEAYLQQGTPLPRALELSGRALQNQQQAGIETRLLARYQTGQILATRAWALARAGQRTEAAETLAQAFARADKSFKPVLAGVYWRAGQTMLALGEHRQAKEHFLEGKRIDPRGHYGRLCAEALLTANA